MSGCAAMRLMWALGLLFSLASAQTSLLNTGLVTMPVYYGVEQTPCKTKGSAYYFNSATQTCETCSGNLMVDQSTRDALGDPTGCTCAAGYYKQTCTQTTNAQCSAASTCTQCASGKTALQDLSGCATCITGITNKIAAATTTGNCACPSWLTSPATYKEYFVESLSAASVSQVSCETCPARQAVVPADQAIAGVQYYASLYKCQSCPDPAMSMTCSGTTCSCACDSGYTLLGVAAAGPLSCVLTTDANPYLGVADAAAVVVYSYSGTYKSQTFQHYFTKAAALCAAYGSSLNAQDCQALANLCVLQLYDDQSTACKTFNAIVVARGTSYTQNIINWGVGMPWLYFAGSSAACADTKYSNKVNLLNYFLKYVVASYTMNGTFVGFSELSTLFQYCTRRAPRTGLGAGSSSSTNWQVFGASEDSKYQCDLDTLKGSPQMFYELYLFDQTWPYETFYPVPVRINGTKAGGVPVNALYPRSQCDSSDVLVRRFFLYDFLSGVTATSTPGVPAVMRYASDIILEVQVSSTYRTIKSPVLSIRYQESTPASWAAYAPRATTGLTDNNPQTVWLYFKARYTMNMDAFQSYLFGFFVAVFVFCGLTFLFRLNNWNVRQSRLVQAGYAYTGLNTKLLFEFVVLAASSWVYFFFPVHLLICWYFFVFFKLQSVPSTLLPPMNNIYTVGSPYFVFTANLHIMAFFQLFYCLVIVYRQSKADIFFLDWQPATVQTALGPKGQTQQTQGRVSAWRTLFVANEWVELMTARKTDVVFSLFWIGFFLLGLGQEFVATQQPDVTNLASSTLNVVLRFANTTWWWFVLSLSQYLWKFLFWERFIAESPEQQFIDFCTIAKVSILVLDEQYHGYYLHCRSPHQNADTSMAELVEMLHNEEAGLTIDRSLDDRFKDVQTFRVYLTGEWRTRFDKIYNALVRPDGGGADGGFGRGRLAAMGMRGGRGAGGGSAMSRLGGRDNSSLQDARALTTAWARVGGFLQDFVDDNLKSRGLTRVIREPTYFERFAGTAPEMSTPDQPCVFMPDRDFEYASVLFYGRELDLLLLNVLAYCLFDLWFGNTAVSILLTYLLDFAFVQLRRRLGLANVANKTLIDSRFLL